MRTMGVLRRWSVDREPPWLSSLFRFLELGDSGAVAVRFRASGRTGVRMLTGLAPAPAAEVGRVALERGLAAENISVARDSSHEEM